MAPNLIESFDSVCLLSGKTRTQVLTEMMKQRVTTAGPKLAAKALDQKALNERSKTAVDAKSAQVGSTRPTRWSPAVFARLKRFSSPDFDPGA